MNEILKQRINLLQIGDTIIREMYVWCDPEEIIKINKTSIVTKNSLRDKRTLVPKKCLFLFNSESSTLYYNMSNGIRETTIILED